MHKRLPKSKIERFNRKIDTKIDLPKSNVLQFILEDGSKISIRPSGTEPKIKFYFGVKDNLNCKEDFAKVNKLLDEKLANIATDLKIK